MCAPCVSQPQFDPSGPQCSMYMNYVAFGLFYKVDFLIEKQKSNIKS